jgi:hypothetical protein
VSSSEGQFVSRMEGGGGPGGRGEGLTGGFRNIPSGSDAALQPNQLQPSLLRALERPRKLGQATRAMR